MRRETGCASRANSAGTDVWTWLIKRTKGTESSCSSGHLQSERWTMILYPYPSSGGGRKGLDRKVVQKREEREPNEKRKVGLIGCRRRAILRSPFVIRQRENAPSRRPSSYSSFFSPPSLSLALLFFFCLPFYLNFPRAPGALP